MAVRSARPLRSLLAAMLLAAVTVAAGPTSVSWAHAELVSSTPQDGATLDAAPTGVTLTFTDEMDPKFVRTAFVTPAGQRTVEATTQATTVTVPVPADGPGAYRLVYRVVSADGHPVSGQVGFTVKGTPTATPAASVAPSAAASVSPSATPAANPSAAPAATPSSVGSSATDGGVSWLVAALALVALAGAGAVVAATRGRRS